jgi:uncharacterized spore protein YtfJ
MDLLVALNVVLDLLMGCTSGGVRFLPEESTAPSSSRTPSRGTGDGQGEGAKSRMVHFRTLD